MTPANPIPIFTAKNAGTYLQFDQPARLATYLKGQPDSVEVVIRAPKKHNLRSRNQNNYYFGVVCALIAEATGYTGDQVHEGLKNKFLGIHEVYEGKRTSEVDGLIFTPTTTSLSTVEFEDYLKEVREWAQEFLGVTIPKPNEAEWD